MKTYFSYISAVLVVLGLGACASGPKNPPPQQTDLGPSVLVDAYKMSVGDTVNIHVWKNPDLSISAPVRPDGKIAMPLLGDVMAAGREPEEMAADISTRLAQYVKSPVVTVSLTGLQGHKFLSRIRVTGEVGSDTSITYAQGMTVLDAILEAGSVTDFADSNNTKLYRRTAEGGSQTYTINLEDIMEKGDMSTNVLLLPGDVISVPQSAF